MARKFSMPGPLERAMTCLRSSSIASRIVAVNGSKVVSSMIKLRSTNISNCVQQIFQTAFNKYFKLRSINVFKLRSTNILKLRSAACAAGLPDRRRRRQTSNLDLTSDFFNRLDGFIIRVYGSFQEWPGHPAQIRAQSNALGDIHTAAQSARGKNQQLWSAAPRV